MAGKKHTVDITTAVGTFSFPRVFASTKGKKDDGVTDSYDIQFLIPKTDREGCRAIINAMKEVGLAAYGENWKQTKIPLRDGDKEAGKLATDGETLNRDKYPERLGHYFINARSTKPVAVVDRSRTPINEPSEIYGGCKGKIAISFYPYNSNGNVGIGASLNGVQKISDGESFGGGRPAVESMFDMMDEADDIGLDEEVAAPVEVAKAPAKKAAAKKAAAPAPAAAEPVEVDTDDDLLGDTEGADDDSDGFDDLDD